jgi:hypothetical protein
VNTPTQNHPIELLKLQTTAEKIRQAAARCGCTSQPAPAAIDDAKAKQLQKRRERYARKEAARKAGKV